MKEKMFWFYFLSFTWGIIWTLLGLIAFPFILIFFNKKAKVKIIRGRIFVVIENSSFGGISLGLVIAVDKLSSRLINHEIGHTIQNALFGPFFIFWSQYQAEYDISFGD